MKTKTLFIVLVLIIQNVHAQTSEVTIPNGITNFISWITSLDEQVDNIYKVQKKNKLIRQLGYVGTDLDYLAEEKRLLAATVIAQHDLGEDAISIELLQEYKESIDNLSRNLSKLIVLLNDQYQIDGNEILDAIRFDLTSRKEVELKEITKMITNESEFNETLIRESAERARLHAISAKNAVFDLRAKLLATQ